MSVGIKTHVVYPKIEPKKLIGFSASAAKKRALSVGRSESRRHPLVDLEKLYAWTLGFAERNERAPQMDALTKEFGGTANAKLLEMARAGRLVIEVGLHNYRVIHFGEIHTLMPARWNPYMRINRHGRSYHRGNGKWEAVS